MRTQFWSTAKRSEPSKATVPVEKAQTLSNDLEKMDGNIAVMVNNRGDMPALLKAREYLGTARDVINSVIQKHSLDANDDNTQSLSGPRM